MFAKWIKLWVVAICVGTAMLIGWLVFPDSIEAVLARLGEKPNRATQTDIAIFIQTISIGFASAFVLLRWVFTRLGRHESAKHMKDESDELRAACVFIAGLGFAYAGIIKLDTSYTAATIYFAIAAPCLIYMPYWYVNSLIMKYEAHKKTSN